MSESLSGSYAESLNGKPLGCSCLSLPNPRAWVVVYFAVEPYPNYENRTIEFSLSSREPLPGAGNPDASCRWVGYYDRDFWWMVFDPEKGDLVDKIVTVRNRLQVSCWALGAPEPYVLSMGWEHWYDPPAPWGVGYIYGPKAYSFLCPLQPPLVMPIVHDFIQDGEVLW